MARPQSIMFTLYGDYIRQRGGEIWVGSLIRVAAQFGLSQQAVRSSLSRMTQNGWLKVRRVGNRSYYGPTARLRRVLEEGERRIFTSRAAPWDRQWRMLVYSIPEKKRDVRTELRKQLSWLGYGPLSSGSWVCPHDVQTEVDELVSRLGITAYVERFTARHDGFSDDAALSERCWDLKGINARYNGFIMRYRPLYESFKRRSDVEDAECFVQRFSLLHEYRKFFFIDPDLPRELLPGAWKGTEARELFHEFHTLLAEPANRYFDSVFEAPPARRRHAIRDLAPTATA